MKLCLVMRIKKLKTTQIFSVLTPSSLNGIIKCLDFETILYLIFQIERFFNCFFNCSQTKECRSIFRMVRNENEWMRLGMELQIETIRNTFMIEIMLTWQNNQRQNLQLWSPKWEVSILSIPKYKLDKNSNIFFQNKHKQTYIINKHSKI